MTCWLLAALLLAGHPDDLNVRAETALRAAVPAFVKLTTNGGAARSVDLSSGRR
ncbi:MAG: hypothetical protein HZB16_07740, partial [Armatimonadetes bacterium]|nr:hypothetical protein [Armatimonadota bacterium]